MLGPYRYSLHRLLLDNDINYPPLNRSVTSEPSNDMKFDSNMVIILAALLCALVCALGLNSIVRCALRCSQRFSHDTPEQVAARLASTGVKKESLSQIPVVVYRLGLNIPVTDCPICIGEYREGDKLQQSRIRQRNDCFEPKNISLSTPKKWYKLVKGAMLSFLKPESLQNYIKHMDELVTSLFLEETKERDTIKMVTFMKKLTFSIACKILFGIHDDQIQDSLFEDFSIAFKAVWSLPLNIIGTAYWRGLKARSRIENIILKIMKTKKEEMSLGKLTHASDIIACLLKMKSENEEEISEQVIVDNFFTLMIASHDTSAILLSIMVWKMSKDQELYKKVCEEQMGILKNIEGREEKYLNWGDIQKMKYTWRVAQEILRMIPPVFGSFRRAVKDTSFAGYDIPKGWQVFWTAYGTHMNEDVFENPMMFDPSRFDNLSKPIPPYTYIPFGGGLHTCIGNEFARVETLTIIHKLVTMYKWSTLYSDEVITRQPMPYPSMGLPIKVNPIMSS